MQTLNVFYVTTPHGESRYEIGKFFSAEAAHGFIASMQIKEGRVEPREESAHEQHEAHADVVGLAIASSMRNEA